MWVGVGVVCVRVHVYVWVYVTGAPVKGEGGMAACSLLALRHPPNLGKFMRDTHAAEFMGCPCPWFLV